jgi:4-alpha-glucanotransferase
VSDAWGIEARYEDALGEDHHIAESTVDALRQVIGKVPEGMDDTAPLVVRLGDPVPGGAADLVLEDGTEVPVAGTFPEDLPYGYHTLAPAAGGASRRLIVTPGQCHLPAGWRAWGFGVQLYATRSKQSWGMGDLGDLRRFSRWASSELGAGFVLINPLPAVSPVGPQQPSPYFPASRRFANPIYINVPDVAGASEAGAALEAAAQAGRALNARREIDRDEVWRLKRSALEAIWDASRTEAAFEQWRHQQTSSLTEFATWCVLSDQFGACWRTWPTPYQDPGDPEVARFAAEHVDRVRFYSWLQWLIEGQLANATSSVALIEDLPIGIDPDGADAWSWNDLLAGQVTVGSPPDEFNVTGQDWGLPPFVPWRLRDAGYQPFIDTIRATLAGAGGLRIDHVMGLFRLWWIPGGAGADAGAYVRYPSADLLDIVALESHRAGAVVIGEDLGTVEPGVREAMAEHRMLSYRLLWFEERDPAEWPATAMAAVTTHDLPTVAGLWDGSDLDTQRRLALQPNEKATEAIRRRLADDGHLNAEDPSDLAVVAAHRLLGRAPSTLLVATLDDALAEPERPNIPRADGQRPNWSLALPQALEDIEQAKLPRQVATSLVDALGDVEEGR